MHDDVKRRGQQYNIRVNSFEPPKPPRPPRQPLRTPTEGASPASHTTPPDQASSNNSKRPISKESRASISSFVSKYFDDSNPSEHISNRDQATICSLGAAHLHSFDANNTHPLQTLLELESMMKDESEPPTQAVTSAMINSVTVPESSEPTNVCTFSDEVLVVNSDASITQEQLQMANDATFRAASMSSLNEMRSDQFKYEMFNNTVHYEKLGEEFDFDSEDEAALTMNNESTDDTPLADLQDPPEAPTPAIEQAQLSTIVATPQSSSALLQSEPFICANIVPPPSSSPEPIEIDQEFRNAILMAQRNHGAPSNMISLIQRGNLSINQARQLILHLNERSSSNVSMNALAYNHASMSSLSTRGNGSSRESPIDLTTSPPMSPSSQVIDLTHSPTVAASTASLREEPQPTLQQPTGIQASLPSNSLPIAPDSPPVSSADGAFNPEGMRRLSE